MQGLSGRLESDVVVNPFSWNTVVLRYGSFYSVNHYPRGTSVTTGRSLPERFEFRYELQRRSDWDNQKLDPGAYGVTFNSKGYAVYDNSPA